MCLMVSATSQTRSGFRFRYGTRWLSGCFSSPSRISGRSEDCGERERGSANRSLAVPQWVDSFRDGFICTWSRHGLAADVRL
jgi:hypothetical protein